MEDKVITVYEHSRLYIRYPEFKQSHFDALVRYNDLHGSKYFTIGYQKIIFKSYVGVIQVGDRVIEILPKVDDQSESDYETKRKWQSALLYMLKKAGYLKLNETEKAAQQSKQKNLLDIYLYTYLKEVENLIYAGLVKKYRKIQANEKTLRGKLLIKNQIRYNSIHRERFFVEHTTYDRNNKFNALIKKALEIVQLTTTNHSIKQGASRQLLYFEGINSWHGADKDFDNLVFDRKTKSYTYAIELARMIMLSYNPDMSAGKKPILAILFDMNQLFEKFVYRMLKSEEPAFAAYNLSVTQQKSHLFWKHKTIRPDIIIIFDIEEEKKGKQRTCIVDTKWKVVQSDSPGDGDLKQMYAYNVQFGATQSILLYPFVGQKNIGPCSYQKSPLLGDFQHCCELFFTDLFKENVIDEKFANRFLTYLVSSKMPESAG